MTFVATQGPMTFGWIVGLVLAVLLGICTVVCVLGLLPRELRLLAGIGLGVLAVCWAGWLWASWPLDGAYHHWQPTSGVVASVGKRIVNDGSGNISEKYVLRFTDGRVRALSDTIGGTLQKGDRATLRCKKAYDFGVPRSAHGWDCKWAGRRL